MKEYKEFHKRTASPNGVQSQCKECKKNDWRERCGWKGHREKHRAYLSSYLKTPRVIAARIRTAYGYSHKDSLIVAEQLTDDLRRCAICGMPSWLVKLNYQKGGPWFNGMPRQHTRMHPDRINTTEPHTLDNTRILCPHCNIKRGAERHTDEEVLRWVRKRWTSLFPPRMLFWLNTTPGAGGRDHRNPQAPPIV